MPPGCFWGGFPLPALHSRRCHSTTGLGVGELVIPFPSSAAGWGKAERGSWNRDPLILVPWCPGPSEKMSHSSLTWKELRKRVKNTLM